MGLFDSVHARCPHCRSDIELQSKAGECYMAVYEPDDVPVEIAYDLVRDDHYNGTTCRECGKSYKVIMDPPIPRMARIVLVPADAPGRE